MPAKSPEALARKRARLNERKRAAKAKLRADVGKSQDLTLSSHKITARRLMPRIGDLSKAELRAMLAAAVLNTGG